VINLAAFTFRAKIFGSEYNTNNSYKVVTPSVGVINNDDDDDDNMAGRSKARTVFDRLNTTVLGSNPARGMYVCPRFSVLCCPVCR
jgi:hypothetical protein